MLKVTCFLLTIFCVAVVGSPVVNAQTWSDQTFTEFVAETKGEVSLSVRETLKNDDHIFYADKPTTKGHSYLSFNSLGKSDLSPEQVMNAIKLDPDIVFPVFTANGKDGQAIKLGNTYDLELPGDFPYGNNPVKVTDVGTNYFVFSTLPGHTLQGSASHGILKDNTGELWLFQEGRGVAGENESLQKANYLIAEKMWSRMAGNAIKLVDKLGRYKGNVYVVKLNRYLKTNIVIEPGDQVRIDAAGQIIFGSFAGSGYPEGINFNPDYNYFKDIKHGALIGRLGEKWFLVGRGISFVSSSKGVMELNVNDRDFSNNVGLFTVNVIVSKPNTKGIADK